MIIVWLFLYYLISLFLHYISYHAPKGCYIYIYTLLLMNELCKHGLVHHPRCLARLSIQSHSRRLSGALLKWVVLHVCMYIYIYICVCVCVCVWLRGCMYVYVCVYVCAYEWRLTSCSQIHGIGVMALRDIAKDTVLPLLPNSDQSAAQVLSLASSCVLALDILLHNGATTPVHFW